MKRIGLMLLPLLAAGCATSTLPGPGERDRLALDRALAGRVAGQPVDCLSVIDTRDSQSFDNTILYRPRSKVAYLQTFDGCPSISWTAIPVFNVRGSQICRGEIVQVIDRGNGFPRGACTVGQFIPYTKVN